MKTPTLLTLPAIFAALLFSCSKDNNPTPSTLQKMPGVMAIADTDPTAADGPTACYRTYFGTVQSKPSGYIPGTAEIDLANCLNEDLSGGTPGGPRLMPPAPPVVLTPAPPSDPINTTPPPVDDNLAYLVLFSVQGYGFFLHPRTLEEAAQLFDRYAQLVCAAVTENISFPNPTYIDKAAASVIYATNHPEVFQSAEDKELFLRFLGLVFAKPTFIISWSRGAIDTGGILFLASASCVNTVMRLPPRFPF